LVTLVPQCLQGRVTKASSLPEYFVSVLLSFFDIDSLLWIKVNTGGTILNEYTEKGREESEDLPFLLLVH
jgi:hypothetical protein